MVKPYYTESQITQYLLTGYYADTGGATHRLPSSTISINLNALNADARVLATAACGAWAESGAINFVVTTGAANIVFTQNNNTGPEGVDLAVTYASAGISNATINVAADWLLDYGNSIGSYGYETYMHEIGHALGLGHAGPYNFSASYSDSVLGTGYNKYANDTLQFSVMSYFPQYYYDFASPLNRITPSAADIEAVQRIYGYGSIRLENNTYGYGTNAGSTYDANGRFSSNAVLIIDGGGYDTLDLSYSSVGAVIDLTPGSFSSAFGRRNNIQIDSAASIEKAVGGFGDDSFLSFFTIPLLLESGDNHSYDGGGGFNTIDYSGAEGPVYIVVSGGGASSFASFNYGYNFDHLTNIQRFLGTSSGDSFGVHAGELSSGQNLSFDGKGGTDGLSFYYSTKAVLLDGTSNVSFGASGSVAFSNIELVQGSELNDVVRIERNSMPTYSNVYGGSGTDTLDLSAWTSFLSINAETYVVSSQEPVLQSISVIFSLIWDFEKYIGGSNNDLIVGFNADETLDGRGGSDVLRGGMGNDTYAVDRATDQVFEAIGAGTDKIVASASYTLIADQEVEQLQFALATGAENFNLKGNNLSNTLIGNDGNNVLNGGEGVDILRGGKGDDTFAVDNTFDQVFESAGRGKDTVVATTSYSLAANQEIENLQLALSTTTQALNLSGNNLSNTVVGNDGENIISGGGGADTLRGGKGNDTYSVDNALDQVIEGSGRGTDRIVSTASYKLADTQSVEFLQFASSTGTMALNLTGNNLDNTLGGNKGSNILTGGLGIDTLRGGGGADRFVFNLIGESGPVTPDTVTDFASGDKLDVRLIHAVQTSGAADNAFVLDGLGVETFGTGHIMQTLSGTTLRLDFNTDADAASEMAILLTSRSAGLLSADVLV